MWVGLRRQNHSEVIEGRSLHSARSLFPEFRKAANGTLRCGWSSGACSILYEWSLCLRQHTLSRHLQNGSAPGLRMQHRTIDGKEEPASDCTLKLLLRATKPMQDHLGADSAQKSRSRRQWLFWNAPLALCPIH